MVTSDQSAAQHADRPEIPSGLGGTVRHALALVDEAEEDVLGTDVVVVEHARFFLRKHHHAAGTVGEPFKHVELPRLYFVRC